MSKGRIALGLAAGSAAVVATLLGGTLADGSPSAQPATPDRVEATASRALSGFSAGNTAGIVAKLQADVRARPDDVKSLGLLGLAYQQRARETADPAFYPKSEDVLRQALERSPRDLLATSGLASLALTRHRFREGLALGRQARRISPTTARNYGVIGDALVQLGRYDEAFRAFDTMARLRPSLGAYARVSYARELLGDQGGALDAMRLALGPATGQPEPTAWTRVELGKLHWARGEVAAAGREYRAALRAFPGYVYALDALASVEQAEGRPARAIAYARRASDSVPLPQFVTTLGDLHAAQGDRQAAQEQYDVIDAIGRLLVANGVKTDLETALFNVDHGIRLGESLALARRAHADRPSIDADDVLAWALERTGHCGEALRSSKRALRLGTLDALKFFHRGMIERCLGREPAARRWFSRALRQNPHFSLLWAPVARKALA